MSCSKCRSRPTRTRSNWQHAKKVLGEMESKIQQYKEQYAQLITSVNQIKRQMQQVQENCTRSTQLLTDLSSEKVRWQGSSKGFQEQTASMIGDVLICGAFLHLHWFL